MGGIMNKFESLDASTKFLFRLDFFWLISLTVAIVTYYQIIDVWQLEHQTAIYYSYMLGFGTGGLAVISIRHYRKSRL